VHRCPAKSKAAHKIVNAQVGQQARNGKFVSIAAKSSQVNENKYLNIVTPDPRGARHALPEPAELRLFPRNVISG
jgi:hypothetical protein